jgi:hypothetical protein
LREGFSEKIHGPTKDNDGTWGIKTNDELETLTLYLLTWRKW